MRQEQIEVSNTLVTVFHIDGFWYAKCGLDLVLMGEDFPNVADVYKALYRYKCSKQAIG